jgi:hypothetical protein
MNEPDEVEQPAGVVDVEDEVQKELQEIRKVDENLFTSVRLDTQCRKLEHFLWHEMSSVDRANRRYDV